MALFAVHLAHVNLTALRLCLIWDYHNCGIAYHRETTISLTFPDRCQIPGLFHVFQVRGHPNTTITFGRRLSRYSTRVIRDQADNLLQLLQRVVYRPDAVPIT